MKLVADESVDGVIVERLRAEGHEIFYVAEMRPGIADIEVLELAKAGKLLLLTGDKDFGDLVFRQGLAHCGVLLFRIAGRGAAEKAGIVANAIGLHGESLGGRFAVLTPESLRIRGTGWRSAV